MTNMDDQNGMVGGDVGVKATFGPCPTERRFFYVFPQLSFVKISSKYLHSQTVRASELKFQEKVQFPLSVMCHASHVIFHMSRVT